MADVSGFRENLKSKLQKTLSQPRHYTVVNFILLFTLWRRKRNSIRPEQLVYNYIHYFVSCILYTEIDELMTYLHTTVLTFVFVNPLHVKQVIYLCLPIPIQIDNPLNVFLLYMMMLLMASHDEN